MNFVSRSFSKTFDVFHEPIIAPHWFDLTFVESGFLYHRVSTDPTDLSLAANLISSRNADYLLYQPTHVVIVTWKDVQNNEDRSQKVSHSIW